MKRLIALVVFCVGGTVTAATQAPEPRFVVGNESFEVDGWRWNTVEREITGSPNTVVAYVMTALPSSVVGSNLVEIIAEREPDGGWRLGSWDTEEAPGRMLRYVAETYQIQDYVLASFETDPVYLPTATTGFSQPYKLAKSTIPSSPWYQVLVAQSDVLNIAEILASWGEDVSDLRLDSDAMGRATAATQTFLTNLATELVKDNWDIPTDGLPETRPARRWIEQFLGCRATKWIAVNPTLTPTMTTCVRFVVCGTATTRGGESGFNIEIGLGAEVRQTLQISMNATYVSMQNHSHTWCECVMVQRDEVRVRRKLFTRDENCVETEVTEERTFTRYELKHGKFDCGSDFVNNAQTNYTQQFACGGPEWNLFPNQLTPPRSLKPDLVPIPGNGWNPVP